MRQEKKRRCKERRDWQPSSFIIRTSPVNEAKYLLNTFAKRKAENDISKRPSKMFPSLAEKCETDSLEMNDVANSESEKKGVAFFTRSAEDTYVALQSMYCMCARIAANYFYSAKIIIFFVRKKLKISV